MDKLDAAEPNYMPRMRLRALWRAFSVVVRIHSGASTKALLSWAALAEVGGGARP
jgi:hypothetical protein